MLHEHEQSSRRTVVIYDGFISFAKMALVSRRIFAGFIQHEILYENTDIRPDTNAIREKLIKPT